MKFLIDNNLSVRLSAKLRDLGHDAVHVRDRDLGAAADVESLHRAAQEDRVVVSGDRDFGALLVELKVSQSSVVYLRGRIVRTAEGRARLLHDNLTPLEPVLRESRIIVIEPGRLRVCQLPFE